MRGRFEIQSHRDYMFIEKHPARRTVSATHQDVKIWAMK